MGRWRETLLRTAAPVTEDKAESLRARRSRYGEQRAPPRTARERSYLLILSAKARRSALGSVAMARARLHGFGFWAPGGAGGRDPNAQPLQRPAHPPSASSVSRAEETSAFPPWPRSSWGEGSAPPPAAPPGLARTERSARAWTPRRTALRILRVAGCRRALPAADPGPTGTAAAERGPRALAGNAGGPEPKGDWGSERRIQKQPPGVWRGHPVA